MLTLQQKYRLGFTIDETPQSELSLSCHFIDEGDDDIIKEPSKQRYRYSFTTIERIAVESEMVM